MKKIVIENCETCVRNSDMLSIHFKCRHAVKEGIAPDCPLEDDNDHIDLCNKLVVARKALNEIANWDEDISEFDDPGYCALDALDKIKGSYKTYKSDAVEFAIWICVQGYTTSNQGSFILKYADQRRYENWISAKDLYELFKNRK